MSTNSNVGGSPAKVLAILGSFLAKLAKWDLDVIQWFTLLNKLKKEQVLGLIEGTYNIIGKFDVSFPSTTIILGTYSNKEALLRQVSNLGTTTTSTIDKLFFSVADKETPLEVLIVSKKDLALPEDAPLYSVITRAQKMGLKECPNETGPQLRIQFQEQPVNQSLLVISEGCLSGKMRLLFQVSHDKHDGLELLIRIKDTSDTYPGGYLFVFCRPRR